jgi:DNA topoisomerase-1
MKTLIIAEKPSVALRIAIALGNGQHKSVRNGRITYYTMPYGDDEIYVAAAVGHLFTIRQKGKERAYPITEIEWAPSYLTNKRAEYTKEYLFTLKKLAQECGMFINACDYDIEGTVIGTNIIKELSGLQAEAIGSVSKRMKFSTTTPKDLLDSFGSLLPPDINNFYAGEARHMLDWLWGINLSRALTSALSISGQYKQLSIGRVQGPALGLLAKREKEIASFKPEPYWNVLAYSGEFEFVNSRGNIFAKPEAESAFAAANSGRDNAVVSEATSAEQLRRPYPPFDLTSLQLEASRVFGFDPSATLAMAQSLYERSFISYPRTSSQKLPRTLGLPRIIADLGKNPAYSSISAEIAAKGRFSPAEGQKEDEAHPAIFPTGVMPKGITGPEEKLYDLIARRFLSCFGEYAKVNNFSLEISIGGEKFEGKGSKVVYPGWLDYYKYAKIKERDLPSLEKGQHVDITDIKMPELQTAPPKRFTKAGLISELEKHNLGTKATRAAIIDTLFKRNYIEGSSIRVTEFGMTVYDALEKNCSMIVDEDTTTKLEKDMDLISKGKMSESEVLKNGKEMLLAAIETFNSNKEKISEEMKESFKSANVLGKCPKDGGDLVIKRSFRGKQFVACSNYPKCTNTYPLPQNAKILPTGNVCEFCHTPIVKIIRRGKPPFEIDLDPNCVTKDAFKKKLEAKAEKASEPQKPQQKPKAAAKKREKPKPKKAKRQKKRAEAQPKGEA